jgi:hypothetical protein
MDGNDRQQKGRTRDKSLPGNICSYVIANAMHMEVKVPREAGKGENCEAVESLAWAMP